MKCPHALLAVLCWDVMWGRGADGATSHLGRLGLGLWTFGYQGTTGVLLCVQAWPGINAQFLWDAEFRYMGLGRPEINVHDRSCGMCAV